MYVKEYRICMPLSVEEYRIGQLYMIAKHSSEQSEKGEGVEVIKNEPCHHPKHGDGQYTEKRIHLSSRLPTWIRAMVPNIFYITEKAWNYYPYTITDYTCSFIPRFAIHIETKYEDNSGTNENILDLPQDELEAREIDTIDIVYDELPEKHVREKEDLTKFHSQKTNRGPLARDWMEDMQPIMCSYKTVQVNFDVWGIQKKVEQFTHRSVRDILLLGHRQAFAWIDEWIDMTYEDIRDYEQRMHTDTNKRVNSSGE
ncbi:hypothetical protein ScPMuIL_004335 [Solemya velum]